MEVVAIVAVIIGVAWFAVPRLTRRRQVDDAYEDSALRGGGALSWLPAWMLFGAMGGDRDHGSEPGSSGHDARSDWGGGGDDGGGDLGGGGGNMDGGFGGD